MANTWLTGWGRGVWGQAGWGEPIPVEVTGVQASTAVGTVTPTASASVYFLRGDIDPKIAAPVAIGVLIGAAIGARVMQRLKSKTTRMLFIPILAYVAVQMILQGMGWTW